MVRQCKDDVLTEWWTYVPSRGTTSYLSVHFHPLLIDLSVTSDNLVPDILIYPTEVNDESVFL